MNRNEIEREVLSYRPRKRRDWHYEILYGAIAGLVLATAWGLLRILSWLSLL